VLNAADHSAITLQDDDGNIGIPELEEVDVYELSELEHAYTCIAVP